MRARAFRFAAAPAALAAAFVASPAAAQDAPSVVASIKPVHSLLAAVMEGVGEPDLLIEGAGSAHTYNMRPSDARALDGADLVFWIGEGLETFLPSALEGLGAGAEAIALSQAESVTLHPYREGGPWDEHEHHEAEHAHGDGHDPEVHDGHEHEDASSHSDEPAHEHGSHDHDGHDHADASSHGAEPAHEDAHGDAAHEHDDHGPHDHDASGHADGHAHDHAGDDMHIWLDPANAEAMANAAAEALGRADPANAARYRANAEALAGRLDTLDREIGALVEPVRGRAFYVFHDAYQYFEKRYDIAAEGSITVSPERMPGARRLSRIRERMTDGGAACVFAEPQFEPRLVRTLTEGTQTRAAVLDPLGADLEAGPDLYFELMGNLAGNLTACLAGDG